MKSKKFCCCFIGSNTHKKGKRKRKKERRKRPMKRRPLLRSLHFTTLFSSLLFSSLLFSSLLFSSLLLVGCRRRLCGEGPQQPRQQTKLEEHRDASVVTMNLNMNDDSFKGSALEFIDDNLNRKIVQFRPGEVIFHLGSYRHAHYP